MSVTNEQIQSISAKVDLLVDFQQKVSEQLTSLNISVIGLKEEHKNLSRLITGVDAPEKGLIVRVDRMERDNERRKYWVRTSITASFAALMTVLGWFVKNWTK